MIERICSYSKASGWGKYEPDVCELPVPFGPENLQIIDISDENNPVVYDLKSWPTIKLGDREEIKLKFKVENSIIIDKGIKWDFTFDGSSVEGNKYVTFKRSQLKDTPELVKLTYLNDYFNFSIEK